MNGRTLLALVVVALALLLFSLNSIREPDEKVSAEAELLLKGLNSDDIFRIDITAANNRQVAQLELLSSGWQEQITGYSASSQLVRTALNLTRATRLTAKTSAPGRYAQLGVSDTNKPDAAGLLLRFFHNGGAENPVAVIIGDPAPQGHFVRLEGDPQSWLIDQQLQLPRETVGWLETTLIDIPAERLRTVELWSDEAQHDDSILFTKKSAGQSFSPAEGHPNVSIGALAGMLSELRFAAVHPAQAVAANGPVIRAEFITFDGLLINAICKRTPDGWRVSFSASHTGDKSTSESKAVADEAITINHRVDGWAFSLPEFKLRSLLELSDKAAPAK